MELYFLDGVIGTMYCGNKSSHNIALSHPIARIPGNRVPACHLGYGQWPDCSWQVRDKVHLKPFVVCIVGMEEFLCSGQVRRCMRPH